MPRAILIGQREDSDHRRLAFEQAYEPGITGHAPAQGPADHGHRTGDEQSPDVPLAHLRGFSELLFAAGRGLPRDQSKPGRKVAPPFELIHRWREGLDG